MNLTFPLRGKFLGIQSSKQPAQTSRDLNNVRPFFDGRAVGGQRPGMDKVYSQRISDASVPIVSMCSITVVD